MSWFLHVWIIWHSTFCQTVKQWPIHSEQYRELQKIFLETYSNTLPNRISFIIQICGTQLWYWKMNTNIIWNIQNFIFGSVNWAKICFLWKHTKFYFRKCEIITQKYQGLNNLCQYFCLKEIKRTLLSRFSLLYISNR